MDGPEHLDHGVHPGGRGARVLVAVLVVVVAGLAAFRLTGQGSDPTPPPSPPPSAPTPDPAGRGSTWPVGVGRGIMYVLDAGGVLSIDVASGLAQHVALDVDPAGVVLTATQRGVLVGDEGGTGAARLVAPGRPVPLSRVQGPLAGGVRFLPGPGVAVWVSPDGSTTSDGRSTWRLVDEDGQVSDEVRTTGAVGGDGAGGLFETTQRGTRHVVPGQPSVTWPGSVQAVGPDGVETLRCGRHGCRVALHDRATGQEEPLAWPTSSSDGAAVLSPRNRFVASVVRVTEDDESSFQVRVRVPGDSSDRRTIPAPSDGRVSPVWLSERWLATTTDQGLVLYDAVDDRLVVAGVGVRVPAELAFSAS